MNAVITGKGVLVSFVWFLGVSWGVLHPDIFANGGGQKPTEQEFKVPWWLHVGTLVIVKLSYNWASKVVHVLPISGQQFLNTLLVPSHLPVYSWYFRMSTLSLCWIIMRVVYPRFSFVRTSLSSLHAPGVFRTGHSNGGWPGNSTAFVDALHAALWLGVPWSSSVLELESGKIHFPQGVLRCFVEKRFQPKCLEVLKLFSSTPLFQQVWGTSLLKWGKPRNESIIAALTGQQSPENDKEDFWCCGLTWFFLASQCGGDDDDDANDVNDVNDINDVTLKRDFQPQFFEVWFFDQFPKVFKDPT